MGVSAMMVVVEPPFSTIVNCVRTGAPGFGPWLSEQLALTRPSPRTAKAAGTARG
jgi:hypothetical protein